MIGLKRYRARFHVWMNRVLPPPIPDGIAAFVLHLYEGVDTFDAQIAGSYDFTVADRDWMCNDAFSSGEELFSIRRGVVDNSWHDALRLYLQLMDDYLSTGRAADVLAAATGVGVGFVDGDLVLLRPRMLAEPVHAVFDYSDGVRTGVAEFEGEPHAFRREFDDTSQDWTNFYRLKPLTPEEFSVVMTDWAVWKRWLAAYRAGDVALSTHPALPQEGELHQRITPEVAVAMSLDDATPKFAWATFDGPAPPGGELQVNWLLVPS